jgi:CENP-B N-terminal DNA-binding domain.
VEKLTRENKIEIYERSKRSKTISSLVKFFNVCESTIEYLLL